MTKSKEAETIKDTVLDDTDEIENNQIEELTEKDYSIYNYQKDCRNKIKEVIKKYNNLNAFEILGKTITDAKGKEYQGLGIFDFTVVEQERVRNTADAIFSLLEQEDNAEDAKKLNGKRELVGFINKCSTIKGITTPMFEVKMGLGNENKGKTEGIVYKNFFGTHLTGPMLIKNPYFLQDLASKLCGKEMNGDYLNYEKAGYEITLRELSKRLENK